MSSGGNFNCRRTERTISLMKRRAIPLSKAAEALIDIVRSLPMDAGFI